MHTALADAVGELTVDAADQRASVTMDALMVAAQHGEALRALLGLDIGVSGVALLRMQYDALLRAVWALFVATPKDLAALSAPLTPATTRAANKLGLTGQLLEAIERSAAPADLKRALREVRTSSWDVLNSYVHAALHPLRRLDSGQEHEMTTALRMSNGLAALTCGLMVVAGRVQARQHDINVVIVSFPECMPPRHMSEPSP
jgi:hypothetical protein